VGETFTYLQHCCILLRGLAGEVVAQLVAPVLTGYLQEEAAGQQAAGTANQEAQAMAKSVRRPRGLVSC
jgi:hypothetical protein